MLLKVLKIICVLCFSFDNTLKEGTFVQNVHSILAQNRFLKAPGNFSTNIPFSSMSIRALLSIAKG